MNMNEMPTPETDAAEMCVKHTHRMLYDEDKVVESDKMRDLERRLTIAREALKKLDNWLMRDAQRKQIIEQALTQTAPKQCT